MILGATCRVRAETRLSQAAALNGVQPDLICDWCNRSSRTGDKTVAYAKYNEYGGCKLYESDGTRYPDRFPKLIIRSLPLFWVYCDFAFRHEYITASVGELRLYPISPDTSISWFV